MGKKFLSGLLAFAMAASLLAGTTAPVKAEGTTETGVSATSAENPTISGSVLDAAGEPVNGATVTLRERNATDGTGRTTVQTGADGTYSAEVAAGEYQVVAIPYEFSSSAASTSGAAADASKVCAVAQSVSAAEETVTQDLQIPTPINVPNGEFEDASGGWTFDEDSSGADIKLNEAKNTHSGSGRLRIWSGSKFAFGVHQTLSDLDAGAYVINAAVSAGIADGDTLYLYVQDSDGNIITKENITNTGDGTWEIVGLEVQVGDSPITVGVYGSCTGGSWANVDEFRMGKLPEETKPEVYSKEQLKNLLDEVAAIDAEAYTKVSYDALTAAKTAAQQVYDNADASETQITEAYKVLQAAKNALVPARTSETPDVLNDTFWRDTDGNYIYSQGGGIFKFGDTYYWYGVKYDEAVKYAADPSKPYNTDVFAGVTCYSSKDLVNWEYKGLVVEPDAVNNSEVMGTEKAVWVGRLGVAYIKTGENSGTYALFVQHEFADPGNVIDGSDTVKDDISKQVLVLTSSSPTGKFEWHQRINMKGYTGGTSNTGDQTVFTDEDTGKSYLLYSYGVGRGKIFISEIGVQEDNKIGLGKAHMIYSGAGREGNCMFKYNNKYYVCASDLYGWNASHAYYLTLDSLEDSALESDSFQPAGNMKVMDGCSDDFCHVSQTGFFYTVKGSSQDMVIFCGDRWSDFAGNGLGYNQWCPLSFNEAGEPYFNSLSAWDLDAAAGTWTVNKSNNYVKNGSFDADRVASSNLAGWKNEIRKGKAPIGNVDDKVTGKYALKLGEAADFEAKVSQTISDTEYVKLPDGTYALTAKIKTGGTFQNLAMYAKSKGLSYQYIITANNPVYTEICLPDIDISGGKVEVGFIAEGSAGAFCYVDDVTLVRSGDSEAAAAGSIEIPVTSDIAKKLVIRAVEKTNGTAYEFECETNKNENTAVLVSPVKPGTYTLTAAADSCVITGDNQEITVTAGQKTTASQIEVTNIGGTITGKVADDKGNGIAEATVKLEKDGSVIEAVTGADGTYTIEDIAEGTYTLTVEKSGYAAPESAQVTVKRNETVSVPLQTMVHSIGTVEGTVLDVSGQPAAGVTVYLRANGTKSDAKRYTAVTDEKGAYRMEVIADQYQILAIPYDYSEKAVDGTNVCAVAQNVKVEKDSEVTQNLQIPKAVDVPNGEFETSFSASDWTLTGSGGSQNGKRDQDCHSGKGHFNIWAKSNFSFELSQTLTVENGSYIVNVSVDGAPSDTDILYIFAKNAQGEIIAKEDVPNNYNISGKNLWEVIGLEAEVTDQTLTIGIAAEMAGGAWTHADEFRVGRIMPKTTPDSKEELQKQLATLVQTEEAFKNSVVASVYTTESWNAFISALEAAASVSKNADADIAEIQEAITNLQKAKNGLKTAGGSVTVTKEALQNAVTAAKSYQKEDYTADSYATLQTAISEAESVLNDDAADSEAITSAAAKLAQAVAGLVLLSTEQKEAIQAKTELAAAVSSAEEQLKDIKPEACTKIAWDTLQNELAAAKALDETAGKEALNDAKAKVANALAEALQSVQAKKELQAAITEAQSKKEADYEAESWKAYQNALRAAQSEIASETATAASLQAALSALNSVVLTPKKDGSSNPNTKPGGSDGTDNKPGGSDDTNNKPGADKTAASVSLNKGKLTLGVKESVQLNAVVKNAAGEVLKGQKIKWSFSKKGIVTVSASGKVKAKKAGKTTITAKTENGKTAKCTVTVKKAVKSIKLPRRQITLKKGKSYTIKPKLLPSKSGTYQITYTSNKKKVATVSSKGKIKALKKGKAAITVKSYNKKKATIKVTVK